MRLTLKSGVYCSEGNGYVVSLILNRLFNLHNASRIELLTYKTRRVETYACVVGRYPIIHVEDESYVIDGLFYELLKYRHGHDIFYLGINICLD